MRLWKTCGSTLISAQRATSRRGLAQVPVTRFPDKLVLVRTFPISRLYVQVNAALGGLKHNFRVADHSSRWQRTIASVPGVGGRNVQ
jgi:hypothetical protein